MIAASTIALIVGRSWPLYSFLDDMCVHMVLASDMSVGPQV